MKRICFILPHLGEGGAERVATHLLNNLNLKEYELNLVIIYRKRGDYLEKLRKEIKVKFLDLSRIRASVFKLYKYLKMEKFDIVIIFSEEIMILLGIFVVPFIHRTIFINRHLSVFYNKDKTLIRKVLLRLSYKNFDGVITQSKDMTRSLLENKLVKRDKIVEINNPVDFRLINEMSYIENELEFDKGCKNLIAVGRLTYQKGFDLLINNMKFLKNENIKLFILGEGPERKNLEELIGKLQLKNKIFLIGRKSNPYIYMKNADLFILSSRYEGFPNVLLEANFCGCYAICNNSPGGINEIIKEPVNGTIINFNDEQTFIKTIKKELKNVHDKEEIKKTIERNYSLEKIIKKYSEYIELMIKKGEKDGKFN